MAENPKTKSKRELFNERMAAKYPDRQFADDEELFGQIGADYDDYDSRIADNEKRLGEYEKREGELTEMFRNNPKGAQFVTDMAKGVDPWIAVVERMGVDGITEMMNDPEKKAAYEEANQRYIERIAREKELEAEYERNEAETLQLRDKLNEQYGEETVDAAFVMIDQIFKDALVGKVTPKTFEMALKALKHDADVDNARSEGEIAGRNAKIEEGLRKRQAGDGIPASGGAAATPERKKKRDFFDIANAAK